MAKFGTFTFSNELYGFGNSLHVSDVEIISPRLVKLVLSSSIVTNSAYFDISSYQIKIYGTSESDAVPVRVLTPFDNETNVALYADYVLLVTQPLTIGTRYSFSALNLKSLTNETINSSVQVHKYSRRTKTQSAVRGIPPHFNPNPDSNIASIITAISLSDDRIGGNMREPI
jgi:hypothetical protein